MKVRTFTLNRVYGDHKRTFGVLIEDYEGPFAVTLEDPWKLNVPNISCIPTGKYICKRVYSPRFGNTFEIKGVPGRTHILFHKGNTEADTRGCILVAEEFGVLTADLAILKSRAGYEEFMEKLKGEDYFVLTIKESQ